MHVAERRPGRSSNRDSSTSDEPQRTVLVLGDHHFIVDALNFVFRSRQVGIRFLIADPVDALTTARSDHPDVILIDLASKTLDPVALSTSLRDADPAVRTVALASDEEGKAAGLPDTARFDGVLSKAASLDELADAILGVERIPDPREVHQDDPALLRDGYDEAAFARMVGAQLTFREHEVLAFLVQGASSREIAKELDITLNTLRTHIQNVMTKLQVHSRLQAVMFAVRYGLVPVPEEAFSPSEDEG